MDDDNDVLPMDISVITKERFHWVLAEFSKMALSRHFGQARDSLTPFFFIRGQYMLYRGGIDIRPMHAEQQWLSWSQLECFLYMSSLVDFLGVMGWRRILEFKQDWNEAVIRQFYATLEVRAQKEKLIWMTSICRFKATFRDLVAAVKLSY